MEDQVIEERFQEIEKKVLSLELKTEKFDPEAENRIMNAIEGLKAEFLMAFEKHERAESNAKVAELQAKLDKKSRFSTWFLRALATSILFPLALLFIMAGISAIIQQIKTP